MATRVSVPKASKAKKIETFVGPASIRRITVRDLFGRYSYDLPPIGESTQDQSKVFILYGDNGSGKTTILQLVFHLLSPALRRGHKTFVAKTPFRHLSVEFSDGHQVSAKRQGASLQGSFTMFVEKAGATIAQAEFEADASFSIAASEEADKRHSLFLANVSRLGIDLYYLSDDRQLHSDRIERMPNHAHSVRWATTVLTSLGDQDIIPERGRGEELQQAIDRAVEWIQQQALTRSNLGQANANTIYTEIVKRLVTSPAQEVSASKHDIAELTARLQTLAEQSDSFARFGLTSQIATDDLVRFLQKAPPDKYEVISNVLAPYLDGVEARLAALQEIRDLVTTFVKNINSFYTDKRLEFDVRKGMTILADGQVLAPEVLSSGERQLLLLLSNVLSAREKKSIFIIDEPELSLNVKWQRHLINALLECTEGANIQFLFATHSVELLAGHRQHVVRLSPSSD